MLTTKDVIQSETADPKPVSGVDYAGQPIPPNGFYNGRPEFMQPVPDAGKRPSVPKDESRTHRKPKRVISPERRAALAQRMRLYWQRRREQKRGI